MLRGVFMLQFLCGVLCGGFIGVVVMALFIAGGNQDEYKGYE